MNNYPKSGKIMDDQWIQKTMLEKLKSRSSDLSSQGLKIGDLLKDPDLIRNINYPPAYEEIIRSNIRYLIEQGFVQCDEPLEDIQLTEQGIPLHKYRKLPFSAKISITDVGIDFLKFLYIEAKKKKDENTPRLIPLEKNPAIPSSLIGMLHELKGKFCLFIGAGASTSAGIPCGTQFQTKLLRRLYGKTLDETAIEEEFRREFKDKIGDQKLTLEIIFQGLKEKFGNSAFGILQKDFDECIGPPLGYHNLAYLIRHGFFKTVFTVNLDELLEKSLRDELGPDGYSLICETDRFKSSIPAPINHLEKPLLVKLHGTYTLESTLIVSWEDVQKLPSEKARFLGYFSSNYPTIFIGYSGHDPDIKRILLEASNKSRGHKIFWVSPNELEEDAKEILSFFSSSSNHIKLTADDFFDELEHRLIGGYPCLKNEVSGAILDSGAVDSRTAINHEQITQKILQSPSGYKINERYKGRENRLKRDIEASLQSLIEEGHIEYEDKDFERKYWD
ncbi:MAG: SIR2 family protein [Methanophagales archaeon]|nr:SIR2 family protein [Methanophagales archaeon]